MLLTDARRPARSGPGGELIPLAEQDRSRWDRRLIAEGLGLITGALRRGQVGEYQIAGRRSRPCTTRRAGHGGHRLAADPVPVRPARVDDREPDGAAQPGRGRGDGPRARPGLALLDGLGERLGDHHRLHSVRAHLLEQAGDLQDAIAEFRAAAARTTNLREQQYLTTQAARLAAGRG